MTLSLANKEIPHPILKAIALALKTAERRESYLLGKPKFPKIIEMLSQNTGDSELSLLPSLVGPKSWTIPNMLDLSSDDMVWLDLEPHQWDLISGFRRFKSFTSSLSVVNDSAERGVKLV